MKTEIELDENGEKVLPPISERELEEIDEDADEELKETAYANNFFAFNEEKLLRESVAESDDVRSTDIDESLQ